MLELLVASCQFTKFYSKQKMDKILRAERFDVLPSVELSAKQWLHWLKTFENFLEELGATEDVRDRLNKLTVLINYVSSNVYQLFSEAQTFDEAVTILKALYVKTPNEIYARHALSTRKQQPNEIIDEYLQDLKVISKDCNCVHCASVCQSI